MQPTPAATRSTRTPGTKPKRSTPTLIGTNLPAEGGTIGAITVLPTGHVHALIVSDAEHAFRSAWGPRKLIKGATGIDGMASTKAMAKAGSEAAQRILDLRAAGHADWFLASRLEHLALYQCAPGLFPNEAYWTSTQCSAFSAWCQYLGYGNQYGDSLGGEAWCRPVRRLVLSSFNPSLAGPEA